MSSPVNLSTSPVQVMSIRSYWTHLPSFTGIYYTCNFTFSDGGNCIMGDFFSLQKNNILKIWITDSNSGVYPEFKNGVYVLC